MIMGCGTSTPVPPGKKTKGGDYPVPAHLAPCALSDAGKPATPAKAPPASPGQRYGDAQSHAAVGGTTVPAVSEETGRSSPGGKRIPVLKLQEKLFERVRHCLHAQDKMEISFSTDYQQFFNLSTAIFEEDTEHNTKEQLAGLKTRLFAETELKKLFVTLFSSPLNTVNLDDKSRTQGAIPREATFFAFCNPCAVNTMQTRAAWASDIQKGRNSRNGTTGEYLELDPAGDPTLEFPRGFGEGGFTTPMAKRQGPTLVTPRAEQTGPSSISRADSLQFEPRSADPVQRVEERQVYVGFERLRV